jgi:hypothetical protein
MASKRALGEMLISSSQNRTLQIDADKVSRGSFYTTDPSWLNEPVKLFLEKALFASKTRVLDPFAGDGHLLELVSEVFRSIRPDIQATGFDISGNSWPLNDSLVSIPNPSGAVILTNPPYLANHSAKRKGVDSLVAKYFESSSQDNLYKIALEKSLEAADYVVAVIPETFLLSSFDKSRLVRAVVIEGELFGDTEAPALVACFGPARTPEADIFIGSEFALLVSDIEKIRTPILEEKTKIVFNDPSGRIGLRAVDASDGMQLIEFYQAKDFHYPIKNVKVSSRLMTYLEIPKLLDADVEEVVSRANHVLSEIRKSSKDLALAPFKGNDLRGKRRRRLDYLMARKILNLAIMEKEDTYK